jgi:hypothetical protein
MGLMSNSHILRMIVPDVDTKNNDIPSLFLLKHFMIIMTVVMT